VVSYIINNSSKKIHAIKNEVKAMQRSFRMLLAVFFSFLMSYPVFTQVNWVGKFDDALKQAQAETKFIIMDFFVDWCPPCHEMEEKVYPDLEFINFSRSQIFMHLNAETDSEGIRLSNKFDVRSYPTLIVLDSKGKEIDRLSGGRSAKTLMANLRSIFENPQPYDELVREAKDKSDNYELQYRAGDRAFDRDDYALARLFLGRAAGKSNENAEIRSAALLLLSMACYKDGKYTEALSALDDFERMRPDEATRSTELKLLRGRILVSSKRYEEGQKVLSDLLRSSKSRGEIDNARIVLTQLPNKYRKGNKDYGELLNKAKQDYKKGKLESALQLAAQASDLAPQSAEVHLLLAIINFRMGNSETDAAEKSQLLSMGLNELRFARRLDPEDINVYMTAKDILAAKYLPRTPGSPDAQKSYLKAETCFAQGRYADAVKAYTKTIELEPSFGKAYLHCGDCFFANGRIAEALKFYQLAIVKSPLDASAYRFAADALRKLGKADEARNYTVLSLLADPEYPLIWGDMEQIASTEGRQLQRHADLVPIQFLLLGIDAGSYDESIYDNLPPQGIPAWREYVRSKLLWRQEKFEKAFPNDSFYHTSFNEEMESLQAAVTKWKSLKSENSSLRDESLDFLRQVSVDGLLDAFVYLELFTEEYRASYEMWKQNNPELATNYVERYLTGRAGIRSRGEYNSSAIESYNSAIVSHKAGNRQQAIDLYLKALAQEPEMIPALTNISILYFEMKDYAKAREKLEQWSAAEPDASAPYMMLAEIQAGEGNYEQAAQLMEKGLKFEKDTAKKAQMENVLSSLKSASGIKVGNLQSIRQSNSDESDDRIAYLEGRFKSLKDGDEKDSLALALAVAHFESKHWDQARRYALMIIAKDPAQPTAKAILKALPPE
jgi:tetratricopeptide (TPR) repeat protein